MNVIFVHGWSDSSKSMERVGDGLRAAGLQMREFYFDYRSRDDETTIADYAEGLHEWLKQLDLLSPAAEVVPSGRNIRRTLHFVTHSTGALVVRRWFKQYAWARAADRVATICFLAPANFGSPLAHKGKSFLGKLTKGVREMRDFGETGKLTLEALELASPEQWRLADYDLFGEAGTVYGEDQVRAAVITGASGYGGLRSFVNEDGTDGTIVVAGAGLSSRKFAVDFAAGRTYAGWISAAEHKPDVPLLVLAKPTHSTILDLHEDAELAGFVKQVLTSTPATYAALRDRLVARTHAELEVETEQDQPRRRYQQFVFRLVDDRGDSIPDYFIEFGAWRRDRIDSTLPYPAPRRDSRGRLPRRTGAEKRVSSEVQRHFGKNVHVHSVDSSYRRFLIDPDAVTRTLGDDYVLSIEVTANSGDDDVVYATDRFAGARVYDPLESGAITWTFPDTTTLVELKVDRYTTRVTKLRER